MHISYMLCMFTVGAHMYKCYITHIYACNRNIRHMPYWSSVFEYLYLRIYLHLRFICDPQINTRTLLQSCADMLRAAKHSNCCCSRALAEVEKGSIPPSFFSSHSVNQCHFCGLFHATRISCFLWVIMLFNMAPKYSIQMLVSVPNTRQLWCTLWRKCVLDKVCLAGVIVLLAVRSIEWISHIY